MKRANVSRLKAHLAEYLRMVKKGQIVRIVDRNLEIAEIVPLNEELPIVKAEASSKTFFSQINLTGTGSTNSSRLLLRERESR